MEGMIVAQGGGVLDGIAANVEPIAAVKVRLSLGQGQLQAGDPVKMAASVGAISAVRVMLSLEHGQSFPGQMGLAEGANKVAFVGRAGVTSFGVARISNVAMGTGVTVTRPRFDPQDTRRIKTRMAGNKEKRPNNFLFMVILLRLGGTFGLSQVYFLLGECKVKRLVFTMEYV